MAIDYIVQDILRTYALDTHRISRIRSIVLQTVRKKGLMPFSQLYRCIAELVERFTMPYAERLAVRLDSNSYNSGRQTLHEQIASSDISPSKEPHKRRLKSAETQKTQENQKENPEEKQYAQEEFRGFDTPIRFFDEHRGFYEFMDLSELLMYDPLLYHSLIRAGQLDEVVLKIHPPKDTEHNDNVPKTFRGFKTPLDYLKRHREDYSGMSRSDLCDYDNSLYRALLKHNQMDKAIPIRRKAKSRYIPDEVFEAHKLFNGDAVKAAERLGLPRLTLIRYWAEVDLKPRLAWPLL